MKLPLYQVDAFAGRIFTGNPAAVCPLERWLDDRLLQAIAAENNLAETAYFVPTARGFHIRWFSPVREVDLCGHATLASAHVLFEILHHAGEAIVFESRSGDLVVSREGPLLTLDFPAHPPVECRPPEALLAGLNKRPSLVLAADDYIAVYDDEQDVRSMRPNLAALETLDRRGVAVTAPGRECDIVARFFAPKYGIPEDPVTGSLYTQLVPYWSGRLGRKVLRARQLSARGGDIHCELKGERVFISGRAVTYLTGEIIVPVVED